MNVHTRTTDASASSFSILINLQSFSGRSIEVAYWQMRFGVLKYVYSFEFSSSEFVEAPGCFVVNNLVSKCLWQCR